MLDLVWIQDRIRTGQYYVSKHGDQERQNDNLSLAEIEEALLSDRLLEWYEDTGRGKSCLVAGFTAQGKPLHIVCGEMDNRVAIVTVYIPMPPKFKNPYQRGA